MSNAPSSLSIRQAKQRDVEQFSAVPLSSDEDLLRGSPAWIARSFKTGQCVTLRVKDGHFGGWHIHTFARYFAEHEGTRESGAHVHRAAFRVWCADRPDDARIERVEVDVPYKVLPVQFGFTGEKVDPIFYDDINALCESERARLGHCEG